MANLLLIGHGLLTLLGTAFLIAAVSTNFWAVYPATSSLKVSKGLFKRCNYVGSSYKICVDLYKKLGDVPGNAAGVIAMSILGVIFICAAIIVCYCGMALKKKLYSVVIVLQTIALIFTAGCFALYGEKYIVGLWEVGWSFVIGCVGAGFIGISLVLIVLVAIR